MAQFDVHRNVSRTTGEAIPYLVAVQSEALRDFPRRVVVPLALAARIRALDPTLNPVFKIEGQRCALLPTDLAPVPVRELGEPVCSLALDSDRIVAALDLLFARF